MPKNYRAEWTRVGVDKKNVCLITGLSKGFWVTGLLYIEGGTILCFHAMNVTELRESQLSLGFSKIKMII